MDRRQQLVATGRKLKRLGKPALFGLTLAWAAVLGWAGVAITQQPAKQAAEATNADALKTYNVQHVPANWMREKLRQAAQKEGVELQVVVDSATKRMMVQGSPQAQQLAQNLLAQFDRQPAPETPAGPANPAPELKAYGVENGSALVTVLRERYADRGDVRITYDDRSKQILALASPAVQAQIAQALKNPAEVLAPAQSNPAEPTPPAATNANRPQELAQKFVQLQKLPLPELRAELEKLLGRKLQTEQSSDGRLLKFTLATNPRASVEAVVDQSTGWVTLSGPAGPTTSWATVIAALEMAKVPGDKVTQLVSTKNAPRNQVRQVVQTIANQSQGQDEQLDGDDGSEDDQTQAEVPLDDEQSPLAGATGLIGPVQIEYVEGLDVLVINGDPRDVQRVLALIEEIETQTTAEPVEVQVQELLHVESEAMATLLEEVYEEAIVARQGSISITPLVKPNALLLIGSINNVQTVIDLVDQLDKPVPPDTQFEVFNLSHAVAQNIKTVVDEFFAERTGLGTKVLTTADYRSNSVIVRASPRDLVEVRALIEELDTAVIAAVNQVKIFKLQNSLAADLAEVLRASLAPVDTGGQQGGGQFGGGQGGAQNQQMNQPRSKRLQFIQIDAAGRRQLQSGALTDVTISADERSNALVVTAPKESMELIAALIEQLDQVPDAEAAIKVFTISRGDAGSLVETLQELFAVEEGGGGQQGPGGGGLGAGESTIVGLRFSVDDRTNSIIAAGSAEDLATVDAIILRLEGSEVLDRRTTVYRLKNAPAQDVAQAINDLLTGEREVQEIAEGTVSAFEQREQEVIVVPELNSNSLLVSSTREYYERIRELVERIDERPPMVLVQVLIAEVSLNDTDEFGVEMALQDSLLFDRSVLDNIQTTTTTTTTTTPGGAVTTVQEDLIQSADILPGFQFSNPSTSLGNSGSSSALATAGKVAAQGISSLAVGRVNSELGFGGFVLSAGSENLNFLLRALQESRRLQVLSRPQIMALDGRDAFVQIGESIPVIQSVNLTQFGQNNVVQYQNVGLLLSVRPVVSPDGMVVMQIEATKSDVGPLSEGIPVSVSASGEVITQPRINITQASTTVYALSGQTIVLGGLIQKGDADVHRRVPLLADIPLLGDLFRFDSVREERNELLIIMTPRVVRNYIDAEMTKQIEAERMNWVLCDVIDIHGESGLRGRHDEWREGEVESVYPSEIEGDFQLAPTPEDDTLLPPSEVDEVPSPIPPLGQNSVTPIGVERYGSTISQAALAETQGKQEEVDPAAGSQPPTRQAVVPLPPYRR